MKIFVLEDDEERQNWFLKRFFGEDVDIAANAIDGLKLLDAKQYDAIFLDHDLKFEHYGSDVRDDDATGYAVAGWLARNGRKHHKATIVVHSMNPSGGKRMVDVLRDHGLNPHHLPFPQLRRATLFCGEHV